jgi:phenylacetate-CoA ligase
MSRLKRLYPHLPYPLRSAAAALHGYRLWNTRYGPGADAAVSAALERDRWSSAQWLTREGEVLPRLLRHAAANVPYYREQWSARRRAGDHASVEYLENWPILEKSVLRALPPSALLADSGVTRPILRDTTSGTTGTPLTILADRAAVREWYALHEARTRLWHGVSRHDRWAILGGQLVAAQTARKPPFWVWNAGLRQLYMSSYHLAPAWIGAYLDALWRYRVRYILGYTSALVSLARHAVGTAWQPPPLAVVLTNAEPLRPHERALLQRAFGCPVRETYGMSEMVAGATECEAGRLHVWRDAGILELLEPASSHATADAGADIVCTTLLNHAMPLVRYRIGDRATAGPPASCPCGRTLPLIESIDGRNDDVLYTVDGREVGRLDPVFKEYTGVHEAQIIQERIGAIRVRYVPAPGNARAGLDALATSLRERLGDVDIAFEAVDAIERTAAGKFRAVVCRINRPVSRAVPVDGAP